MTDRVTMKEKGHKTKGSSEKRRGNTSLYIKMLSHPRNIAMGDQTAFQTRGTGAHRCWTRCYQVIEEEGFLGRGIRGVPEVRPLG